MESLRKLAISGDARSAEDLRALCSPTHRLQQLEEIDLSVTAVEEPHMAELVRLEGMHIVQPNRWSEAAVALLPRLRHLHSVRLDNASLLSGPIRAQTCATLGQCSSITAM